MRFEPVFKETDADMRKAEHHMAPEELELLDFAFEFPEIVHSFNKWSDDDFGIAFRDPYYN